MEQEKAIKILADVHIAEAALQNIYGQIKDSLATVYYDQIYEINDIEKEEFDSLMAYLYRNPGEMEAIYTEVLTALKQAESKYEEEEY